MNNLINAITDKHGIPSFDTRTLLKSFNNLIKNFEFENSEEQTDVLLRNLKEARHIIFNANALENGKIFVKKDNQGRWCRISQDNQKLEPIKFKIKRTSVHKTTKIWKKSYQELVKFKERYGHTNATRDKDGKLASWVSNQRQRFKNSKITKEEFEKLNDIGFEWDRTYFCFLTSKEKTKKIERTSNLGFVQC